MVASFSGDWPQFKRTPDRRGCALDETVALPSTLCAWFDFGSPVTSSPAIVNGKAYVLANNGLLACLDLAAGTVVWKRNIGGATNDCSPAVSGGKVYAGSVTGVFYVLDAATGAVLNQYEAGSMILAAPLVLPAGVYFGSFDGIFHALNLDGGLKWRDTGEVRIVHAAASSQGKIVYVDGNTNMVWLEDSGSYARRVRKMRNSPLTYSSNTGFVSHPMIWKDTIITGFSEAEMGNATYYTDFRTGAFIKSISITGGNRSPALLHGGASVDSATGRIFFATAHAGLYAGWETAPYYGDYPDGLYGVNTPPAVLSNCVIFGSENNQDTGGCAIHFHHKTSGANIWSYKPASYKAVCGGPAVSGGKVLVGSMDGCVYGFWGGTEVTSPVLVDSLATSSKRTMAIPGKWTLTVFPNPASTGRVNLELAGHKGKAAIAIYDISGHLVQTLALPGKGAIQWDLRDMNGRMVASGSYYAVVRSAGGKLIRTFNLRIVR